MICGWLRAGMKEGVNHHGQALESVSSSTVSSRGALSGEVTERTGVAMEGNGGSGGTTLLIASTGGHLEQLLRIRPRLVPEATAAEWVTFDDPQSRSLLAGELVHHVRYVAPRNPSAVALNVAAARRVLRSGDYARLVTTGSAVALSFLPLARTMGIPCHFIESAARASGPSTTGKLISRVPGVKLYAQYESWAGGRWAYRGSPFDGYRAQPRPEGAPAQARRVVITFGTMRTYGFRRAAEALVRVLPEILAPDAEVLWQTGVTDMSGLEVDAHASVPGQELRAAIAEADLVIAHAGVGTSLTTLDLGRSLVLLPRLKRYDEMVDDHQLMIAKELDSRGLAVSRDPDALTAEDLRRSMAVTSTVDPNPPPFALVESRRPRLVG